MKYIFGLGNPGKQYEGTRHNIGFASIDHAVVRWLTQDAFTLVGAEKRNTYESWEFRFDGVGCREPERLYCIKPLKFMNCSGDVVSDWLNYAPSNFVAVNDLWIVHDELDVSLGSLKIGVGNSSAGHNGVQSIIDALGSNAFVRFRLGITPMETPEEPIADFVLKRFTPQETEIVEQSLSRTVDALEAGLSRGIAKAQTLFSGKLK